MRWRTEEHYTTLVLKLDQGNPTAQYNLGLMYKNGIGVEKDFNEALGWFILLQTKIIVAKYALGLMYYKGEGIRKITLKQ